MAHRGPFWRPSLWQPGLRPTGPFGALWCPGGSGTFWAPAWSLRCPHAGLFGAHRCRALGKAHALCDYGPGPLLTGDTPYVPVRVSRGGQFTGQRYLVPPGLGAPWCYFPGWTLVWSPSQVPFKIFPGPFLGRPRFLVGPFRGAVGKSLFCSPVWRSGLLGVACFLGDLFGAPEPWMSSVYV